MAGFVEHNSTRITRGGDNGRPINFWNDSLTQEHFEIKSQVDKGDVEIFGMTAGHDTIDRIEGHREWINYAIQNNPNVKIFIAIPQIDFQIGNKEHKNMVFPQYKNYMIILLMILFTMKW